MAWDKMGQKNKPFLRTLDRATQLIGIISYNTSIYERVQV